MERGVCHSVCPITELFLLRLTLIRLYFTAVVGSEVEQNIELLDDEASSTSWLHRVNWVLVCHRLGHVTSSVTWNT